MWGSQYIAAVDKVFARMVSRKIEKRSADTPMLSVAELARRAQLSSQIGRSTE